MAQIVGDLIANVSHLIESATTVLGSPTRNTNDDASSRPAIHRSHSPTDSHQTSSAADTFSVSSPRRSKREALADVGVAIDEARPAKKLRLSADGVLLAPEKYNFSGDPILVPDPLQHCIQLFGIDGKGNMGKPGASSSYRPLDSISRSTLGFGGPPAKPKTYGSKQGTSFSDLEFLDRQQPNTPETKRPYEHSSGRDSYSSKRRKIEHNLASPAQHVIDVDLADDVVVHSPSARTQRSAPLQRSVSSASRRNIGNAYATSGIDEPSLNELESSILHNKIRNMSPSRAPRKILQNGNAHSPIITIEDDEPAVNSKTPRQTQFTQFKQGLDSRPSSNRDDLASDTVSKHFFRPTPKINQSTFPPRGEPDNVQGGRDHSRRDLHQRHMRSNTDHISDDELTAAPPEAVKRSKMPWKQFSRNQAASKRVREGAPPRQGWLLLFARTHDYEGHTPPLTLKNGQETTSYRIVGANDKHPDMMTEKHEIFLSRIVKAETDEKNRIRLTGPREAKGYIYVVDLQFEDSQDLATFRELVVRSVTASKVLTRAETFMQTIFSKPLHGGNKASVSTPSESGKMLPTTHTANETSNGRDSSRKPKLVENLLDSTTNEAQYGNGAIKRLESNIDVVPVEGRSSRPSGRPTRTTRANQTINLDIEDEKPTEVERYSEVHGLGAPWNRQLNYGSGRRRAVVDFTDLERLDDGEFLNDQLIDFYLLYLFNQAKVPSDKVYIFNTHFFTTLTRKVSGQKSAFNYAAVARWTSKEDLFGYDYIVVPINQDVHWYLAIICNVSNISRKPAIDEAKESSSSNLRESNEPGDEETTKPNEAKTVPDESSVPPSTPIKSTGCSRALQTELAEDENLFDEGESGLNLVDPNAARPGAYHAMTNTNVTSRTSPPSETAQMEKLTISEGTPKGILPATISSPISSKKPKRKPGPPAKKWDLNEPTIIILDSLGGGPRSQAVRVLKDYIREEAHEKRGMEANITQNAFYAKQGQVPMQENLSDCGVYLLGYAQKFFDNPDEFKARLLKGDMQRETDWPDMPMPAMRNTMRQILFDLHKQQEEERRQAKKAKKMGSRSIVPKQSMNKADLRDQSTPANNKEGIAGPTPNAPQVPTKTYDSVDNADDTKTHLRAGSPKYTSPRSTPRLGSPFQPQATTEREPETHSPVREVPIKVDGSPEPPSTRNGAPIAAALQNEATESTATVTQRRFSPQVVIPSRSPTACRSPKRTHDQSNLDKLDDVEIRSPKRHRSMSEKAAAATYIKSASRGSASPRKRPGFSRLLQLSPAPVFLDSINVKDGPKRTPTIQKPSAGLPGSSQDPISIDDSQDAIDESPSKPVGSQSILPDSQDSVIITSPKTSRHPALHLQLSPRLISAEKNEKKFNASPIFGTHHSVDQTFVGDALDTQLKQAQQETKNQIHPPASPPIGQYVQDAAEVETEEEEFQGFSDNASPAPEEGEPTGLGDDVVQETPPERRSSPGTSWNHHLHL